MFGIAEVMMRLFGVGAEARLKFITVAGILIGLLAVGLGLAKGRTVEVTVGVILVVASATFWPWLIRLGRRRGTLRDHRSV
jgi:uncharacterized membrane protein YdfJ with MMPL/SSD domain